MEQKTHYKKLSNPNYLGAYELLDGSTEGKELIVTVSKVTREMVAGADGKSEECTVCHLEGNKPMILNATNQKAMTKAFGSPYIEDWSGKKMTLYVARIKAFGDVVDALRVRPSAPITKLPELTPSHPKWGSAKKAIADKNTTIESIKKAYSITAENEKLLLA